MTFTIAERVHVNYSTHHFGITADRGPTHVAVQLRLGILPKRRPRPDPRHRAGFGVDGTGVASKFSGFQGAERESVSGSARLKFRWRMERGPDFRRFSGLDSTEAERRQASHGSFSAGRRSKLAGINPLRERWIRARPVPVLPRFRVDKNRHRAGQYAAVEFPRRLCPSF